MAIPPILCYVMCTSYVHMHERVRTCSWISVEACRQCSLCSLHACFPLLICQKSSGLIVKSIWLVLGLNPSWLLNFFFSWIGFSLSQQKHSQALPLVITSASGYQHQVQWGYYWHSTNQRDSVIVTIKVDVFMFQQLSFFFQKVVPKYNIRTNNNY